MLNRKNSGALYQDCQCRTVDLGSNGRRCARAPDRAVSSAHGSTVDRPFKREGVSDPSRPCKIQGPWTCACGMRRRARWSVAARGRGSLALPLGGVPGHLFERG
jgi:hypothetical protein